MQAVHNCFEIAEAAWTADEKLPPHQAEHLADLLLLRALRRHPSRVSDPTAARVHFTGLTPSTSSFLGNASCAGLNSTHEVRMTRAATALARRFRWPSRTGVVYVLPSTYWNCKAVLTGAMLALMQAHPQRFFYATEGAYTCVEAGPVDFRSLLGGERIIALPYVASALLDAAAARENATCGAAALARRNTSFFFAGQLRRNSEGALRAGALRALGAGDGSALIVDASASRRAPEASSVSWYAERMLSARYCLVPAGDTPSSRRLFDALAAGCIPVYVGDVPKLAVAGVPFSSIIDWSRLAQYTGSMSCLLAAGKAAAPGHAAAATRAAAGMGWLDAGAGSARRGGGGEGRTKCEARRLTFLRSLSYRHANGHGVVTALLREVDARLRGWHTVPSLPKG